MNKSNTALKDEAASADAEPSMDEILASIKQIIADDEDGDTEVHPRDLYTHPTDASNTNTVNSAQSQPETTTPDLNTDVIADLQAAMQAELSAEPTASELGSDAPASEAAAPQVEIEASPIVAASAAPFSMPIDQRAALLRDEVAQTTAGMTPDERLAAYRVRNQLRQQGLSTGTATEASTVDVGKAVDVTKAAAAIRANLGASVAGEIASAPTAPVSAADGDGIARQMASQLLDERKAEIETLLTDMMRPTIRKWLTENLPGVVEKLVREEIESVAKRRRPRD
ncbi:MAG: DUF2497 domain-containing protein [Pseudomonadota bacterium]